MLSYGNPFLQIPIMKNSNKYISTLTLLLSGIFPSQTFGQDYRGQNISTLNLAGQDLSAAQFDSTTIFSQAGTGVNLSGTNAVLSGISGSVNFGGVNLASVSFQGSDLSAATFDGQTVFSHFDPGTGQQQGVNLSGTNAVLSGISGSVNFGGVNLASVSFQGSDLSAATFDGQTVFSHFDPGTGQQQGVNLSGTNAVLSGISGSVNFGGVNLASVSFQGSDLSAATFDGQTVFSHFDPGTGQQQGVNLSGTNAVLSGISGSVNFGGVNLASVSFQGSDLSAATFDGQTVFSHFDPGTGQQQGVNLSGTNAVLSGISGSVNFGGVNLASVSFQGSDLSAATFDGQTVFSHFDPGTGQQQGVNLSGTNAVLSGISGSVNFGGVNLASVSFQGSDLSAATFDGQTVFSHFDPGTGQQQGVNLSGTNAVLSGISGSVNFGGVNLASVSFQGSDLSAATFDGQTVFSHFDPGTGQQQGVNLSGTNAVLSGISGSVNFGGVNLASVSFQGSDLSAATFDGQTVFSHFDPGTGQQQGVNLSGTNAVLSGISGSVNFGGVNLASVSFQGSDLSAATFDGQTVFSHFDPGTGQQQGVNLSGTNAVLSGISGSVNFGGVNLASVSFQGSDLSAATFDGQTVFSHFDPGTGQQQGVNLSGTNAVLSGISGSVNFGGVNLASVSFQGSDLSAATFDGQTVFSHFDPGTGQQQGVNLSGTNAVLSGISGSVNFGGVNLASVSFQGSDLSAATFDGQTVFSHFDPGTGQQQGVNLSGTNAVLSGISGSVNFGGVNLASVSFQGSDLSAATFDGQTVFSHFDPGTGQQQGVNLSGTNAVLSGISGSVNFGGVNLASVSFQGSDLSAATFDGQTVFSHFDPGTGQQQGVNLSGTNAVLSGISGSVNFGGVNLASVSFQGSDLSAATFDGQTVFSHFDPGTGQQQGVNLSGTNAVLSGISGSVNFGGVNLASVSFQGSDLSAATFDGQTVFSHFDPGTGQQQGVNLSGTNAVLSGISGSVNFGGVNLASVSFQGSDLSAATFDGQTVFSHFDPGTGQQQGVNLSGTNAVLSGISGSVNFGGVNLASVSFQGSDLSAATFDGQTVFSHFDPGTGQQQGVNLSGTNAVLSGISGSVNFGGVNLASVSFQGSDLSAATFDGQTVFSHFDPGTGQQQGVNLSGTNAVLSGISGSVNFGGVNLASVSFQGSDLSAATFDGQTVFSHFDPGTGQQQGVNLSGTNAVLSGISGSVNFGGVNLASVSFQGSDLSAATFDGQTVFSHFDPGTGQQQGVNLSGTNAVLSGISGSVNFGGVNLASVSFQGSDLSAATFDGQTVFSQSGTGVNLSGTNAVLDSLSGNIDLRGANLSSVSFTGSNLSTAQLTGATYDNTTTWPVGFDPVAAGATSTGPGGGGNSNVADQNNTIFIVGGGSFASPFYDLTFEANGSIVDFQNYSLFRGNTYTFKAGNLSSSHPFNIGTSHNISSQYATGGPLDQNSAGNGQTITVTIPSGFNSSLAYYCTLHSNMLMDFIITDSNGSQSNSSSGNIEVYQLEASHISELTTSSNSIPGNYSIVEELNASNLPEIRIRPMIDSGGGNWANVGPNQYYYAKPTYSTLASINSYLAEQGIQAINSQGNNNSGGGAGGGGNNNNPVDLNMSNGLPVFSLSDTQVQNLTNGAQPTGGNFAVEIFFDPITSYEIRQLVAAVMTGGNWTKELDPFSNSPIITDIDPSTYPTMETIESFLTQENLQSVGSIVAQPNNPGGGAGGGGNNNNPVDLNMSNGLPVFSLSDTQVQNLTNGAQPTGGNFAVEIFFDPITSYEIRQLVAAVMTGGNWTKELDPFSNSPIITDIDPSTYPTMETIESFLTQENLQSVGSIVAQPNNPGSGAGGGGNNNNPVDLNMSNGLPVFSLSDTQVQNLTNGAQPTGGNFAVEIFFDPITSYEIRQLVAAVMTGGNWTKELDPFSNSPIITDIDPSTYPTMETIESFLTQENLQSVGSIVAQPNNPGGGAGGGGNNNNPVDLNMSNGLPVFSLSDTQVQNLTNGAQPTGGNFAVEIFFDPITSYEIRQLVAAVMTGGNWTKELDPFSNSPIITDIDPSTYPTMETIESFLTQENLQSVGSIVAQPNNPGSGAGGGGNNNNPVDLNMSNGLPVFSLSDTQVQNLTNGAQPTGGNFAVEIFFDPITSYEIRQLVAAVMTGGNWTKELDPFSNSPIITDIDPSTYPTMETIESFLTQENLQSVGSIVEQPNNPGGGAGGGGNNNNPVDLNMSNGLPVFSLSDTQVQNLTNGAQPTGGNFAVEIFFDPITSYEIRQLVAAVMTGGNWTKELDPFSNSPIITDIDPSTYPTMETIESFLTQENLQSVGSIVAQPNNPGGGTGGGGTGGGGNNNNPVDLNMSNGLPVFSLSDTQVQNLTNGAQPAGGNFAVEIFFDPITSYEIRQLVAAVMTGGNWTKELDPFSNSPIITDIDPSTYPTMETIESFLTQENLQSVGSIVEQPNNPGGGAGPPPPVPPPPVPGGGNNNPFANPDQAPVRTPRRSEPVRSS